MKGTYNIRYDENDLFSPGQALYHHHYQSWRNGYLQRWRKPWSTFVSLCRSLHELGLHYKVLIIEDDGRYSLQVNAWGSPTFKRKKRSPQRLSTIKIKVPAPLTPKRCSLELQKAKKDLEGIRQGMKSSARLKNSWHYPSGRYGLIPKDYILRKADLNHRLGKWLACRISTKGRTLISYSLSRSDYAELDVICSSRVQRISTLDLLTIGKVKDFAKIQSGGIVKAYVLSVLCNYYRFDSKTWWQIQCESRRVKPIDLIGYNKAKAEVEHWAEMLRLVTERLGEPLRG